MLVKYTLFEKRPEVGGEKLYPLTAGRVALLEELGNPLGAGKNVKADGDDVFEAYLVCSMSGEELADATADMENWKRQVRVARFTLEDTVLNDFWQVLQDEIELVNAKFAQPVAKKTTSRQASGRKK